MRYFPINLDVQGRKVLVVGGGKIALRKVRSLLAAGATVTVVSPEICRELMDLKAVVKLGRAYRAGDIDGACLVIGATDNADVNREVWKHASAASIPCNVVDQPDLCSFTIPAVLTRGDLTITISTGGVSPALSGRLRRQLQQELSPVYARHLALLSEMRDKVKNSRLQPAERSRLLKTMAGDDVSRLIENDGEDAARHHLATMFAKALQREDA